MKNLLKIGVAAAFGIAALVGTTCVDKQGQKQENNGDLIETNIKRHTIVNDPFAHEPVINESLYYTNPASYLMKKGKVYQFKFIAPYEAYYIFEATSSVSTKLCVVTAGTPRIYDVGGTTGTNNAKIRIKINEGASATIYARIGEGRFDPASATVKMSVKRLKASIISTNILDRTYFGDLETCAANTIAFYNHIPGFSNQYVPIDIHASFSSNDLTANNFYADEIFGFYGQAYRPEGSINTFLNWDCGNLDFLTNCFDFTKTSLAIWSAFGTADEDENFQYSVAKHTVAFGAKCSIGLIRNETTNEILGDIPLYFMTRLLNALFVPGTTIAQAVEYANDFKPVVIPEDVNVPDENTQLTEHDLDDNSLEGINSSIDKWNEVQPVRVYGDPNFVLVGNSTSNGVFSLENDFFHNPGNPGKIDLR